MDLVKWTDSLNIGIEIIDDQHKVLVRTLNQLYDAFMNKEHQNVIGTIIDEMINYTDSHFKVEENYFVIFNYENTAAHIIEHDEFRKQAIEFKEKYEKNPASLTFEIMNFLQSWLTKHIKGEDRKYIDLFKSKGLK